MPCSRIVLLGSFWGNTRYYPNPNFLHKTPRS